MSVSKKRKKTPSSAEIRRRQEQSFHDLGGRHLSDGNGGSFKVQKVKGGYRMGGS